jgi:hypothetical protein
MASLIPEVSEGEPQPAAPEPRPAAITVAATPQALVAAAGRGPRKPAMDEAAAG